MITRHAGAAVTVVDYTGGSISCAIYRSKLDAAMSMVSDGTIVSAPGESSFGSRAHQQALVDLELRIAETRRRMDDLSRR